MDQQLGVCVGVCIVHWNSARKHVLKPCPNGQNSAAGTPVLTPGGVKMVKNGQKWSKNVPKWHSRESSNNLADRLRRGPLEKPDQLSYILVYETPQNGAF